MHSPARGSPGSHIFPRRHARRPSAIPCLSTPTARHIVELLSRYDLSMAQIHSGETSLSSGAYFLIPTILRIHPIRELVVVESDNRRLRVLADVLRRTPIPYVRVLGKISEEDRTFQRHFRPLAWMERTRLLSSVAT
ncbi:hypothetical protein C8R46DRAFT_1231382 [Mycena filopes]|nr:hypothetical protein C8R46DRAFT_1231382 [Mycena filopes]